MDGSVSFVWCANSDIYCKQERVAVAGCLLFQVINIEMLLPGHTDRDYEGEKVNRKCIKKDFAPVKT